MTKAELYNLVEQDRQKFRIDYAAAVDSLRLCKRLDIDVGFFDFKTPALRGVAWIDHKAICLSSRLSPEQCNFYAAHELFHHMHHGGLQIRAFKCYEIMFKSDLYYEWEANEGAAEMLVPYRDFLRLVGVLGVGSRKDLCGAQRAVANVCNVPLRTAVLRFDSLKYELRQYLDGIPLERIEVMSAAMQAEQGIMVKSFNEIFPAPRRARGSVDILDGESW